MEYRIHINDKHPLESLLLISSNEILNTFP